MNKEEKLKAILYDLDVETIEQADERLDSYLQLNEFDDIDRICGMINACSETLHARKISFNDYERIYTSIAIYCRKEFDGTQYEICLEDDFDGYEHGVEQIAEDVVAFEGVEKSFYLCKK